MNFSRVAQLSVLINFFLATFPALSATLLNSEIQLYAGEARVLNEPGAQRVAVGNGKVLSVSVINDQQLLFLAEAPGSTTVHIWSKNEKEKSILVHIHPADPVKILKDANEMLKGIKGISTRIAGDKIVVEGGNLNNQQMGMVEEAAKRYPQMVNFVNKVGWEKMVHMDVKIVEFNKSALDEIGINWQKSANGPAFSTVGDFATNGLYRGGPSEIGGVPLPLRVNPFRSYFGIVSEITSRLNFLVNNGDALILAEPKLSCRSGGEAKFLAGGEVPLPIINALGQVHVTFKQYGISLNIKPHADDTGVVSAKVMTEISSIDSSVTVLGIPGFLTRRTETEMNVKENETLVISGLLSNETSKDVDKVAGLGELPVLGALFRSTRFRNKQTELVIFVTPKIMTAGSPENTDRISRAETRSQPYLERLKTRIVE